MMPVRPGQRDGIQHDRLGHGPETSPYHHRRWVKRYRTEVAASLSSILSTFAAVRYPNAYVPPTPQLLTLPTVSLGLREDTNADVQI